jgi:hypothetical protein
MRRGGDLLLSVKAAHDATENQRDASGPLIASAPPPKPAYPSASSSR